MRAKSDTVQLIAELDFETKQTLRMIALRQQTTMRALIAQGALAVIRASGEIPSEKLCEIAELG